MAKPVLLTRHAFARMEERDIRFEWVAATARKPLWTEPEGRCLGAERRFAPIEAHADRILRVVCIETDDAIRVVIATRQRREVPEMIDITYDPEADAAYIRIGKGTVAKTSEAGPFIYDADDQDRVLGIEILRASKVLAPGSWRHAPLPGRMSDAAE